MGTTMKTLRLALGIASLVAVVGSHSAQAAGDGPEIARKKWSFSGPFGHFDKNQLQRGFQVYKEVCSTCHGISRIAFRNLIQKGGPAFPEAGVRSLAASWPNQVPDITEAGESAVVSKDKDGKVTGFKYVNRPARLSDRIPGPYKNDAEARSIHNGALPPDLSLIAKGRGIEYTGTFWYHPVYMLKDMATGYQEGGADYLYALITGYKDKAPAYRRDGSKLMAVADKDVRDEKAVLRCVAIEKAEAGKPDTCTPMADIMNYNMAYPGHQIGMAQPVREGQVKYGDGTPGTVSNYAADVSAFLFWAADPTHDERKNMGWQVMLYLLVTAVLLFITKKRIWRDAH